MEDVKGVSADEKIAQITAATVVPKEEQLSDLDELNILENKGIEFVLKAYDKPDLKLYIRPLTLREQRIILELQETVKGIKINDLEGIRLVTKAFSELLKVNAEVLEEYMTAEDITEIFALFACAMYEGKNLFKKKKLPSKYLTIARESIQKATVAMNHGLSTQQSGS